LVRYTVALKRLEEDANGDPFYTFHLYPTSSMTSESEKTGVEIAAQ
jgi:hypothetical protein